ncbi:hypothetical protein [[Mycobacterium] burgundiense]|uniref:Uncharacterized protein n=1 Tax=[Mycobacterium] burgundiense TaxID=3064286 RepID=A0ABM9LLT2_9MYCO|nr:hypothetical protein [Mycolicibacterium sp. MU0053]CAJ1501275.1 hypothetical protein MU0053_001885 [Mycolicibacterium sp. MU0053]
MGGQGNQVGGFAALVGLLFIIGVIVKYIWWILGALAVIVVVVLAVVVSQVLVTQCEKAEAERSRREAQRKRRIAQIAARADRQHAWVLDGDSRGTYGEQGAKVMRYVERGNWDGLLRSIQRA